MSPWTHTQYSFIFQLVPLGRISVFSLRITGFVDIQWKFTRLQISQAVRGTNKKRWRCLGYYEMTVDGDKELFTFRLVSPHYSCIVTTIYWFRFLADYWSGHYRGITKLMTIHSSWISRKKTIRSFNFSKSQLVTDLESMLRNYVGL